MLTSDAGMAEFPELPEAFLPDDEVPDTLLPVLALMARDYLPEIVSTVRFMDAWLAAHPEIESGSPVPASTAGMGTAAPLGHHSVELRGVAIPQVVRHYSLWMFQRVVDHFDALAPAERARAEALLQGTGVLPVLELRPRRPIGRRDGVEVFG